MSPASKNGKSSKTGAVAPAPGGVWRSGWFGLLVVSLIGAVCDLSFLPWLGFYFDDWMIIRSIDMNGSQGLLNLFSQSRPLMGLNSRLLYQINGLDPLSWHLTAFVLRLGASFIFYWGLIALFPRKRMLTLGATLIFLIYPGFSRQPIAIIFSGIWICLLFITFSVSAFIRAMTSAKAGKAALLSLLAALSSLYAYLLYEAFLGVEIFKLLILLFIAVSAQDDASRLAARVKTLLWRWLPSAITALLYVIWRVFFFKSQLGYMSVDQKFQVYSERLTPALADAVYRYFQAFAESFFYAWVYPLRRLAEMDPPEVTAVGLGFCLLCIIGLGIYFSRLERRRLPEGG